MPMFYFNKHLIYRCSYINYKLVNQTADQMEKNASDSLIVFSLRLAIPTNHNVNIRWNFSVKFVDQNDSVCDYMNFINPVWT